MFVPEPTVEEADAWYSRDALLRRLASMSGCKQLYPDGGPELIEFPDFLGEAFVTLQAAEALDPFLADTRVCVRIHTTAEICEVLDGFCKRRPPLAGAARNIERFSLAHADRLIWQGGDMLGTYQRFYGAGALAPGTRDPLSVHRAGRESAGPTLSFRSRSPLRILYAGRLERRKGVQNLVRAATGMARGRLPADAARRGYRHGAARRLDARASSSSRLPTTSGSSCGRRPIAAGWRTRSSSTTWW